MACEINRIWNNNPTLKTGGPSIGDSPGAIVRTDTGCAVPDYVRYVWAVDFNMIGALCLAENLVVEHCYRLERFNNIPERVQCTAAAAGLRAKVAARLDNTSDVTACPVGTSAFAYPAPPRTYCLINI